MKEKIIKIDATVSEAPCLCGKGRVSNYDKYIDHKEVCSVICTCDTCKKYTIRYNPCSKKMFFIDSSKVSFTYVDKVRLTKVSKAHYENEYAFSLEELDHLESVGVFKYD